MRGTDISCEHTMSYFDGEMSSFEKYGAISSEQTDVFIESKTFELDAVTNEQISNHIMTMLPEMKTQLIGVLNLINERAAKENYSVSGYFTTKTLLRTVDVAPVKIIQESIFRLIICRGSSIIQFVDIPYDNNIIRLISSIHYEYNKFAMYSNNDLPKTKINKRINSVILAPRASGFFFHEIIGHLLEFDSVNKKNSVYSINDIGKKIQNKHLTLSEQPHMLESIGIKVGIFDDDGMQYEDTLLIENGVLKDFIRSKRCSDIDFFTQYRMVCLCVNNNPKGQPLARIIEKSKSSIVVDNVSSGWVDTETGIYQLLCNECYIVEHGQRQAKLDNLLIIDNIANSRKQIKNVGCDSEYYTAKCTKEGQTLTVGYCAPTIVLKNVSLLENKMIGGKNE